MTENEARKNETPLESWKEIASYLNRDVRTVKRWEKAESLPIRRHIHRERSSVYAYPSELETWKVARQPGAGQLTGWLWQRSARAVALTAVMLLALVTVGSGPILTPANAANGEPDGMVARQVWAGPGVDVLGAPSPDGRYLTFVDWSTGDLAVRDLTTGENRRLTNKGTWTDSEEFAQISTISPNGRQVAYAWFNKDLTFDLRVVGLDGVGSRVLFQSEEVDYVQPMDWSPDGKHVLVALSRQDRTSQIVLISVADGSVQVLKTLDWRYPYKASLSPDGRYIVYDFPPKEDSPERDIYLLATDGSREVRLVEHPANDLFPHWTPDGSGVLFGSDRTGAFSMWLIQVSEGKPQGPPRLIKRDMGRIFPKGFTQEGSFFYAEITRANDIYVAELAPGTGKLLAPPERPIKRFMGSNRAPEWSPDGKFLAYLSQRGFLPFGVGSSVLSIRSLESGEERELSPRMNYINRLRWSPDGRAFLVIGRDKKNCWGIYRIDAETGAVTPVVQSKPGQHVSRPEWSADGKAVFYTLSERTEKTRSSKIMMRDLETGGEKQLYLARWPEDIRALIVSPDGRELALRWSNQETGTTALRVLSVTEGEPRELIRVQKPEALARYTLAWSADGRYVLFGKSRKLDSLEEQTIELWRIPADGGQPQEVGLAMDRLRSLRVHPDGRRIAFTAGRGKTEMWVLENFLSGQKVAQME